jgi:hypothetical protein
MSDQSAQTEAKVLGVMKFMTMENFNNPNRGMPPKKMADEYMELVESSPKQRTSLISWPQVRKALRRGNLFVIEATTPTFRATLRFSPDNVTEGDYEIHYLRPAQFEKGRIQNVIPVPLNETREPVSKLTIFSIRYAVNTYAESRGKEHMIWLVGLDHFHSVVEPTENDLMLKPISD